MKHMIIFIIFLFPVVVMAEGDYQGLWMGQIEVTDVSESTDYASPKPVKHSFDMTILLHVNKNNDVNLLRHVTIMHNTETDQRALITDDSLLTNSKYVGFVDKNDGKKGGIRLGTLAFGFSPYTTTVTDTTTNPSSTTTIKEKTRMKMDGIISKGQNISCSLELGSTHATNPFKHSYHPDHKKGKNITRNITLIFDEEQTYNDPDNEKFSLSGLYKEEISGLHKNPIIVAGKFTIQRVSKVDTLND